MAKFHHSRKSGSIVLKDARRTIRITMITLAAATFSLRETKKTASSSGVSTDNNTALSTASIPKERR